VTVTRESIQSLMNGLPPVLAAGVMRADALLRSGTDEGTADAAALLEATANAFRRMIDNRPRSWAADAMAQHDVMMMVVRELRARGGAS